MIYPIVAYGSNILRKQAVDITANYENLSTIIDNMWETMYYSNGVGLAAPQVGLGIRLFVVDSEQIFKNAEKGDEELNYTDNPGIKQVFINPTVKELIGDNWAYSEGCLSIPKIREDVWRAQEVVLAYCDENFVEHTKTFTGISARVILHEYDHLEGKLFIDYLNPLKKKLIKGKLNDIMNGKVRMDYRLVQIK
jgi:peptide deformylase